MKNPIRGNTMLSGGEHAHPRIANNKYPSPRGVAESHPLQDLSKNKKALSRGHET